MTVASTDNREVFNGNGVTVAFAFPRKFFLDTDLKVYVDGVLNTLSTDYTVSGAGDENGGTVTFLVAPPSGTGNVVILRDPAATQERDFVENDPLPVEEVENALDLLTMLIQRLKELQARSLTLSDSDADASLQIPVLANRADKLLGFNSLGDLIAVLSADDIVALNENVDALLLMFQNMSSLDFNSVNFDLTPTDTDAIGRLVWNDTDGTLSLGLKGGNSVLQIGQETMIRCVNKTGSTIANGSVVRITGSQGNRVTIVKAQADNRTNAANTVGLATEDIANNAEGFVTALGAVRNIDTSAFTEGDTVYLSSSVAGGLTTTAPSVSVRVGVVERAHATLGRIFVHPSDPAAAAPPQIQPIGASVSANALTISASALSLDFRSTTLGSGAVTTVSGTPSNLVISSGSTLGTINAVQSDIVVLAINNAGTIELAAVNMSGGVDLSETGLISTTAEGGAGAADSATVIYSTTARTNVAYRVIGIIRSTQATAGTWATAPSLIQGAGGNAVSSLMSIGYGQTVQDVTGSRVLGTTYYNTTGKPIFLYVRLNNTSGLVGAVYVNGSMVQDNGGASLNFIWFNAIIPAGASYSVGLVSGSGNIGYWKELR